MRTRWIVVISIVLAAVVLGWTLRLHEPSEERTSPAEATKTQKTIREPNQPEVTSPLLSNDNAESVGATDRARFNEQARAFFAQAPGLPLQEIRRRAQVLSQELSRMEQAGGMSAGETFLLRVGLIRATEPDEQQQAAQLKALQERFKADSRQRNAQATAQSDPMFQLYKVRESEIVAEVLSLQTIPDGLSRDEYLRRRLQAERERLLGGVN